MNNLYHTLKNLKPAENITLHYLHDFQPLTIEGFQAEPGIGLSTRTVADSIQSLIKKQLITTEYMCTKCSVTTIDAEGKRPRCPLCKQEYTKAYWHEYPVNEQAEPIQLQVEEPEAVPEAQEQPVQATKRPGRPKAPPITQESLIEEIKSLANSTMLFKIMQQAKSQLPEGELFDLKAARNTFYLPAAKLEKEYSHSLVGYALEQVVERGIAKTNTHQISKGKNKGQWTCKWAPYATGVCNNNKLKWQGKTDREGSRAQTQQQSSPKAAIDEFYKESETREDAWEHFTSEEYIKRILPEFGGDQGLALYKVKLALKSGSSDLKSDSLSWNDNMYHISSLNVYPWEPTQEEIQLYETEDAIIIG